VRVAGFPDGDRREAAGAMCRLRARRPLLDCSLAASLGHVLEAMCRPLSDGPTEGGEGIVTDLVERLTDAAIANERPALEHDPARLRGVTIELTVANNGAVVEGTCWVERKVKARR
jgi:hypothetical protein